MHPKSTPLVSIITVVFNGEKYLEQTIKSVISQNYDNLEYIIVDGGSTDGTLAIIKRYEHAISQWSSEPDKGLYDAMNKGIGMAKGELVGMINSDDWYQPNAVALVVDAYRNNPSKRIFHGDRIDVLEDGATKIKKFNASRFKFLYYGMTYNHPSMFVHREIYQELRYNSKLRAFSDYEFVLKNLRKNPKVFFYIPEAYVNYRLDGLSGSMSTKKLLAEGFESRKNAGMPLLLNCFSYCIRLLSRFILSFR